MTIKNYKKTSDLFSEIVKLNQQNGKSSNLAGAMFEQFNMYALSNYVRSDIVVIWDTNDSKSIPAQVLLDLFGNDWKLVKNVLQGASYGIDKIVQFVDGTYGLVSDKSAVDETLSKNKIEGILALYPKLNAAVSEWIICSNAKRVPSRISEITKDVITYVLYDDYVPEDDDSIEQQKEENLWVLINESLELKNKPAIKGTFSFKFRNTLQEKYVKSSIDFAEGQFENELDTVKHWDEASMGIGKSLLDPYINAIIQNKCWNKDQTNTNVPININVFDSRRNAKQNGKRLIDMHKLYCGPFKTIWITQAPDVKDDNDSIPHKQTMNINSIVVDIVKSIKNKIPVEICILVHHIEILLKVQQDLKTHFDGFRFWNLNIDECDLLAGLDKASNRNKWFTIDACHQKGSTGTPLLSKGPVSTNHTFMDNLNRWGPRTSFVSVKEAQDQKLIPPLCIHLVGTKLSDIKNLPSMPFKPKKGTPILETPVDGYNTVTWNSKERYMNVSELARFFAVIKIFCKRPELFLNKKITGFTNFQVEAKLFKENYKHIIDEIEGNTLIGRKLKNLIIELLNEIKDGEINDKKLARVFGAKEAMVLSQRLLGRGIDLQFQTAFHLVLKTTRQMLQEIFRLMRLNDKLTWDEQTRHYILPVIINDIDPTQPTIDQEFADKLIDLLEFHTSAKTEMEEIWKSGQSKGGKKPGQSRSFEAIDIDPSDMDAIVKTCAARSPSGGFLATTFERLHTKIFNKMVILAEPTSKKKVAEVIDSFLTDKDFLEVKSLFKREDRDVLGHIWRGIGRIGKDSQIIRSNIQHWKLYVEDYINRRQLSLRSVLPMIRRYYKENNVLVTKTPIDLKDTVLPKLKKLGIETTIRSGTRKGQHIPGLVGSLVKGINSQLSKEDAKKQKDWYKSNVVDKGLAKRQQALDYAVEHWTPLISIQEVARKFNIGKREMTTICYNEKVFPGKDVRPNGAKYRGLDRSKWNARVDQIIEEWKNITDDVFNIFKEWFVTHPHFYSNSTGGASTERNNLIKKRIKEKYNVELGNEWIRKIVGPFEKKKDDLQNHGLTIDKLIVNKDEKNHWHKEYNDEVKKLRFNIWKDCYGKKRSGRLNHVVETIKKYPQLNLKADFIKYLDKEYSESVDY
jgi:hypothetical protein